MPVAERAEQAARRRLDPQPVTFKKRVLGYGVMAVDAFENDTRRLAAPIKVIQRVVPVMELEPAHIQGKIQDCQNVGESGIFFQAQHNKYRYSMKT